MAVFPIYKLRERDNQIIILVKKNSIRYRITWFHMFSKRLNKCTSHTVTRNTQHDNSGTGPQQLVDDHKKCKFMVGPGACSKPICEATGFYTKGPPI